MSAAQIFGVLDYERVPQPAELTASEAVQRLHEMGRVHYPRTRIGFVALGIMIGVWWRPALMDRRLTVDFKQREGQQ